MLFLELLHACIIRPARSLYLYVYTYITKVPSNSPTVLPVPISIILPDRSASSYSLMLTAGEEHVRYHCTHTKTSKKHLLLSQLANVSPLILSSFPFLSERRIEPHACMLLLSVYRHANKGLALERKSLPSAALSGMSLPHLREEKSYPLACLASTSPHACKQRPIPVTCMPCSTLDSPFLHRLNFLPALVFALHTLEKPPFTLVTCLIPIPSLRLPALSPSRECEREGETLHKHEETPALPC